MLSEPEALRLFSSDEVQTIVRIKTMRFRGRVPAADLDDIRQNLSIALWRGLLKFDPGKAQLKTFVSRIMENAANDQFRMLLCGKRQIISHAEQLDEGQDQIS